LRVFSWRFYAASNRSSIRATRSGKKAWNRFLQTVERAKKRLPPEMQEKVEELGLVGLSVELGEINRNMAEKLADAEGGATEPFLSDVVWLLLECGVARTLPGNEYIDDAEEFALFRDVRAVVEVAISVAEEVEPCAVDALQRIIHSDRALVDRLRQALRQGCGASSLCLDCAMAGVPL
jgi:hypothetical protein